MSDHHNKGNQYAAKPGTEKKDSIIHIRVKREEKARFVASLEYDEKLSDLVLNATRKEIERRNKK